MRRCFLCAVLAFIALPLVLANPGRAELAALVDHPRTLDYRADPLVTADGRRWVETEVAVEAVFPGRLEELLALLTDYEASPGLFSRIEAVKLRSREGDVAVTEQRSAVRVLGLAFTSDLVFRNVLTRTGPSTARLSFEMVGGDGSSRETRGGWELEEVALESGPGVYLVYRCFLVAENRFPLQLAIMRAFGKGDFERMVGELGAAFERHGGESEPDKKTR